MLAHLSHRPARALRCPLYGLDAVAADQVRGQVGLARDQQLAVAAGVLAGPAFGAGKRYPQRLGVRGGGAERLVALGQRLARFRQLTSQAGAFVFLGAGARGRLRQLFLEALDVGVGRRELLFEQGQLLFHLSPLSLLRQESDASILVHMFCSSRNQWHRRPRSWWEPRPYNWRVNDPVHEFGSALSVDAEAVGQPGQRRFRLLVLSSYGSACVWMEKEQLTGIGVWLKDVVDRLDADRSAGDPDVEPLPFPDQFDVNLRAGQLALGYVEDRDVFAIQVFDMEADAGATEPKPQLRCFLSRGQSRFLARKIGDVVAAGRKPCPMCGEPMDPEGHNCPRANGHRSVRLTP